jgi:hypothetical protein
MKIKALKPLSGTKITMSQGQVKEVADKRICKDLIKCGYAVEVRDGGDAETAKAAAKPENDRNDGNDQKGGNGQNDGSGSSGGGDGDVGADGGGNPAVDDAGDSDGGAPPVPPAKKTRKK